MARRRYQQGGLRLHAGNWKVEYREDVVQQDGTVKRIRRKRVIGSKAEFPTEKLARRAADFIISKAGVNSLDYRPARMATVEAFVTAWTENVLPMQKPSSQSPARTHVNRYITPMLGKLYLSEISQQTVQVFARQLLDKHLSNKTVRNILITMSGVLSTAREWGYTVQQVEMMAKLPSRGLRRKAARFTPEQAIEIIKLLPYPWNLMAFTAANTGLRNGELLGLRWQDVDFERCVIRVEQSVWRGQLQTTKSEESDGAVPMPESLLNVLKEYRRRWEPNEHDLLWAGEDGQPMDADNLRHRILRPALDAAGIQGHAGWHAFRHMLGTLLVSTGANPKVAQAQLRHADPRITMDLYVDVIGEDHRRAVEKVAGVLAPVGASLMPRPLKVVGITAR